ncbi:MAG: twin-arginine translocation signal domain-containing protein, partial [Planctomycetota bacterium]
MGSSITRREFLKASAAGSLLMLSHGRSAVTPRVFDHPKVGKYQVYFGDLHNHSEVGYARGSLERAFEIAREHLDF